MELSRQCSRAASSVALRSAFRPCSLRSSNELVLPAFLVPAFAQRPSSSASRFSTSACTQSKVGAAPLTLPPDVTFNILAPPASKQGERVSRTAAERTVEVKGPLGTMRMAIPAYISIEANEESRTRTVSILDENDRKQKQMWGTVRAYLQNHILGVSEGHAAILRLVGVGYRATVEKTAVTKEAAYPGQQFVSLKVGYSHPIELGIPPLVKVSTPQPTRILIEGPEKEVVKQFAAEIRAWRVPEPYKGKGIFVNDETIKLKAKKIK